MRAAEAFWTDREEKFDFCVDNLLPPELRIGDWLAEKKVNTGAVREGIAWRKSDLDELNWISPFVDEWKMGTKVDIIASEATDKSREALTKLRAELDNFRGHVKNDLTSIKAGSDRVQTEVQKMTQAYEKAISILNSEAFASAVHNAERMATALEAISNLSETKLSVAVFSGAKGADA